MLLRCGRGQAAHRRGRRRIAREGHSRARQGPCYRLDSSRASRGPRGLSSRLDSSPALARRQGCAEALCWWRRVLLERMVAPSSKAQSTVPARVCRRSRSRRSDFSSKWRPWRRRWRRRYSTAASANRQTFASSKGSLCAAPASHLSTYRGRSSTTIARWWTDGRRCQHRQR